MDYKEKYENGVECIQEILSGAADLIRISTLRKRLQPFFPELKENEDKDDMIRKEIIDFVKSRGGFKGDWLAWLEKQGEQMTKPKFKVRDWIVDDLGYFWRVTKVLSNHYELEGDDGVESMPTIKWTDEKFHLWTIDDANDGDVLTTDNFIFIFKNIDNSNGVHYYCHYEISKREDDGSRFGIALPQSLMGIVGSSFTHYKPATKEQRDLLFQKMKEECYEWNSENKEVKRIEPEFDGDDILLSLSLGNNQVQDILEDMGMLDDNGRCPHTAEEIFKAGMEHAFNLNREAASSVKIK